MGVESRAPPIPAQPRLNSQPIRGKELAAGPWPRIRVACCLVGESEEVEEDRTAANTHGAQRGGFDLGPAKFLLASCVSAQ